MSFYYAILLRPLITMLAKSHFCFASNAFKVAGTWAEHGEHTRAHQTMRTDTHTCSKTNGSMLNSRRLLLNQISMRWHVIYSKRTLWLSNLLSKNTANTRHATSRRVSPRCVCVWQILNGLCLVLLLRKWTWHYSSITTAIPPLISPLFSSLPPLSLHLSPVSSAFFSPPPALLSFWPFQIFFCLLPSVCSISILCRICLILPLSLSPFHHVFYPTLLAYSTFHIFSFPFTFFAPPPSLHLYSKLQHFLLPPVFSPRIYRSPLLSIFKSAPFHHYSLHHSSSLLIF